MENLRDEVCLLRKLVESQRKDDHGELAHVLFETEIVSSLAFSLNL